MNTFEDKTKFTYFFKFKYVAQFLVIEFSKYISIINTLQ